MRVAIIGEFGGSHLGSSYARAFRAIGHEVHEVRHAPGAIATRLGGDRTGAVGAAVRRLNSATVLERLPEADLIFVIKGAGLPATFFRRARKRSAARLVAFHPDDPFNFNGSSSFRHIVDAIPEYDGYFVWSRALVEKVKEAGARAAHLLPFAADPELFHPVAVTDEERQTLGSRVCFIGNWDPERERWLAAALPFGLGIWGNDWDRARTRELLVAWRGRAVTGDALLKVVAASDVHLNILRRQNKGGHNMRTFEIPACGAFLLTERSGDLPLFFKEGEEVAACGDPGEMRCELERYLADPEARARVAAAGHRRALLQTYYDCAKRVLELAGGT